MKKICMLLLFTTVVFAEGYFENWPAGKSPEEIGTRLTERFLSIGHTHFRNDGRQQYIRYPEACAFYGALTYSKLAEKSELSQRLFERFEVFFGEETALIPKPVHVDLSMFGCVPLEIFMQNGDKRCLELGQMMADAQWAKPTQDGITDQARYWIDDMYMIPILQCQAYRATGDSVYIERAAKTMCAYLDRLQKDNGLFYHAEDVPFFWSRGNGWNAAGLAEILSSLPEDSPYYARVMKGYKTMMRSLLRYQSEDGSWRQLLDKPESWPESSGTGMFAFAMITGVKKGWLEPEVYGPAARKAWLALTGFIDEDGAVGEVCEGTNKKNDYQYYLDRKKMVGDRHGQAPVLWSASALLR